MGGLTGILTILLGAGSGGGLITLLGIVLRASRSSPEQRAEDTKAFDSLSNRQDAYLGRLESRIAALEASDEIKDQTIAAQAARIGQLESVLRANGLEIPAPRL